MQISHSFPPEVSPSTIHVPDERKIRLLIVDPQPVVCEGLRSIALRSPLIELVGVCWNGDAALRFVIHTKVDLVLLDLRMTPMSGLELLWELHQNSISSKALVLSNSEVEEEMYESMEAGASGYLCKTTPPQEILRSILAVASGAKVFPKTFVAQSAIRRPRRSLTAREAEVLNLVSKGFSNKEVGRVLGLSQFTIRNQMKRICSKLDASDRTEASTIAMERGIIRQ